jgi:Bacteriocin-protection, YdeI or OmpD-Associated/Domain of unknown function (DUF1905)
MRAMVQPFRYHAQSQTGFKIVSVSKFEAMLQPDPTGAGTFVLVPRAIEKKLGLKGRPKIQAVIAGHPYRGSLMPTPEGFCLGVLKAIQQSAGVSRGDRITVELEIDTAPRVIEPSADLARALAKDKKAATAWEKLSYTNKREIAMSLEEAKKPETRARRLAAAVERLRGSS